MIKNDSEMNAKIEKAFVDITPNILDTVLSDCDEQKGKIVIMKNANKKNKSFKRWAAGIAAALVLVVGGYVGISTFDASYNVAQTVSIDVNPAVQLDVNKHEKVIDVKALNADGTKIIGDMKLKGNDVELAVNALVGSMLREGYISELQNSILISVDGKSADADLQKRLSDAAAKLIGSDGVEAAVISQTLEVGDDVRKAADDYGITVGKAELINKILANDTAKKHSFEELSALKINELNLIYASYSSGSDKLDSVGKASDKAYIGEDAAVSAALKSAKLERSEISALSVELDCERGVMVYEVEFDAKGYEYDYEINAKSGAVVSGEKDRDDDYRPGNTGNAGNTGNSGSANGNLIGKDKAKSIALSHAGLSADKVKALRVEQDRDDGRSVYDVEFTANGYEYSYEIDAQSGRIIESEREHDDDYRPASKPSGDKPKPTKSPDSGSYISADKAKSIALGKAGLSASEVKGLHAERDSDNGRVVYDVEFTAGGYEYSVEIDATSGSVLDYEKDKD